MNDREMLKMCKINNIKTDPSVIPNLITRLEAYQMFGFTEKAFGDIDGVIRRCAYLRLGWTEKAFDDDDASIRLDAYRALGFTKKALIDDDYNIQHSAYLELGYTDNEPGTKHKRKSYDKCILNPGGPKGKEMTSYYELKKKYTEEEAKKIIDLWKLEKL